MKKDSVKSALGTFKKRIDVALQGKDIAKDTKSAVKDMLKEMNISYPSKDKDKKKDKKDKKDKK